MRTKLIGMLGATAVAIALVGVAQPAAAASGTATVDGVAYSYSGTSATATGLAGSFTGTALTIPDTITVDGAAYDVTAIGDDAFRGDGLTSLSLGDKVAAIGDWAFYDNTLATIPIGDQVTAIGARAFGQNSLTSLTIGDHVTAIGDWAFGNNPNLASVTFTGPAPTLAGVPFPESPTVHFLCSYADPATNKHPFTTGKWQGYTSVGSESSLTYKANGIPGVTGAEHTIGCGTTVAADDAAPKLPTGAHWYTDTGATTEAAGAIYTDTTVYAGAPASVTGESKGIRYRYDLNDVDAGATALGFAVAGDHEALTIPDTVTFDGTTYDVTTIGDNATSVIQGAFALQNLTSLTLGDNVTNIGDYAFAGNDLTTLTLGDSITTIGAHAFDSSGLTNLTLGNSITTISASAFAYNSLTTLTLGNSITTIGASAFFDNSLNTLTLGDDITTIGNYAFENNSLTTLALGDNVTTIGAAAFGHNPLGTVAFSGAAPTTITAAGTGHPSFTSDPTIHFTCSYADPSTNTNPFTTGTWEGYTSVGTEPALTYDANGIPGVTGTEHTIGCGTTVAADGAAPTLPKGAYWYTDTGATTKASGAIYADTTVYAGAPAPVEGTADGIRYEYDLNHVDAGATAIGLAAGFTGTAITIPDTVTFNATTYDVTAIGAAAFEGVGSIDAVDIGDNVTTIESTAFARTSIGNLHLGSSVATIGTAAFDTTGLSQIAIPASVTSIGSAAFGGPAVPQIVSFDGSAPAVTGADDAQIPSFSRTATIMFTCSFADPTRNGSRFAVGEWMGYTSQGTDVTVTYDANGIPGVVSSSTTTGCGTAPTPPTVPRGVGWFADPDGTTLASPADYFHDTTRYAGSIPVQCASGGVEYSYEPLHPEKGATVVGLAPSFTGTVVDIPAHVTLGGTEYTVTTIGTGSLQNRGLTAITLPDSVTSIDDFALGQNDLTSVTIPSSVRTIGDEAFGANPRLASVTFTGAAPAITTSGYPSFPEATTMYFTCAYADPATNADPFTLGTWQGRPSVGSRITYTFDANGYPGIDATTTQSVACGDSNAGAHSPAIPTGFHWYVDAAATTLADTDGTPRYSDTTFYLGVRTSVPPAPAILFHLAVTGAPFTPSAPITVTGSGVPAGTLVAISVHSDPVSLGTATADASGAFTLTAELPADLATGAHTITASITVDGTTSTQSVPITVAASQTASTTPTTTTRSTTTSDANTTLAVTGGDTNALLPWAWTGVAALLAGLALVAVRRRRV